ncbi:MAG: hypothetical protein GTO02_18815, partial [Candidatus Dadabacteria bacterium]|nr:hypothetical protein [Candidatus Dadabacteria bacterium]NIQ16362.1 hypothetical protein [Candidatus Dadabacteria bacterium]
MGETKKALQQMGYEKYPYDINFPVAMDIFADESFDYYEGADLICKLNPDYENLSDTDRKTMIFNVKNYLKNYKTLSKTFVLNQLRGTPSFII